MGTGKAEENTISKKKLSFIEEMGNKEVVASDEKMFSLNEFGGNVEADALIKRYNCYTTLSKEDEEVLRNNVPDPPSFQLIPKAEYDKKFCCNKVIYKNLQ